MPEETWNAELVAVLLITVVLFILGLIAVALFIRQYRKEKKDRESEKIREP
jgi:heme/copper-type cytochrome/quinol oxidase subunit 2